MKNPITQKIQIPEGITCQYKDEVLTCKKDSAELSKKIRIPEVELKIQGQEISLDCKKGNKLHYKKIMTNIAHIKNMFHGLEEKYIYELEAVNVHFPMAIKSEGQILTINNFLGEKVPRKATILPNVDVEVKGQKITVSSHDKEAAGQTAANLEKAAKLKGRDRRIFQDGIYITNKPRRQT